MQICFCVHRLPYPPIAGGRTETYRLIEGLAGRGHEVSVISYGDDRGLADEMERDAGCSVGLVPGQPDRTVANLAGNLISLDPLPVTKTRSDRYVRAVADRSDSADLVHLHAVQTSFLAGALSTSIPTVVRFNNVKFPIYRQYARYTSNPAKAAYAYLQYLKSRRYERAVPAAADLTLAITEEDRSLLSSEGNRSPIEVLPAGVDVDEFRSRGPPDDRTVTFFGSMDYHPNEDAARWFAKQAFPRLKDRHPALAFELVGKGPGEHLVRLGQRDGITVTGFVDDITEHVKRATVVVIPIRVGTGVRMKALHAMAMGKPIVSTPIGVQGIRAEDGTHVSIARTAEEFVERVDALLARSDERDRLGRNARALVERDHDWTEISRQLEEHYVSMLRSTEPAA